jgi:hypothetical protein
MAPIFQSLAAAALVVAAGAASAAPLEAIPYDDTTYPSAEVTWFSGTTVGGPGIEHDDGTYPEQVVLGGGAAPAFAPVVAHDDATYPEDSRLMVEVGVPSSVERAADALATGTAAPAEGGEGSRSW